MERETENPRERRTGLCIQLSVLGMFWRRGISSRITSTRLWLLEQLAKRVVDALKFVVDPTFEHGLLVFQRWDLASQVVELGLESIQPLSVGWGEDGWCTVEWDRLQRLSLALAFSTSFGSRLDWSICDQDLNHLCVELHRELLGRWFLLKRNNPNIDTSLPICSHGNRRLRSGFGNGGNNILWSCSCRPSCRLKCQLGDDVQVLLTKPVVVRHEGLSRLSNVLIPNSGRQAATGQSYACMTLDCLQSDCEFT